MGTTGTDPLCTNSTPINVTPAALSITSGLLHFDTSVQDGGHYQLVNVTPCAVKITQMNLALVSTYYPSTVSGKPVWQPIGGIIPNTIFLHTGNSITGTPLFGASVKGPLTPVTGPRLMTFTSTAGVIIPPYSSQDFTLEISSWNMPPGGTLALELYAFRAVKTLTGATLTWAQPTSGIAASVVTAPSLTLVNP